MSWKNPKKKIRVDALRSFLRTDILDLSVLELGAFASPMLNRDEANVFYGDRLSSDELRRSVTDPDKAAAVVDVDYIVPPDFSIYPDRKFDVVIANHVIEHVPDVITWLTNVRECLVEDGVLFLAVPDMRFTFDLIRDPTLTREIIDSFVQRRKQPSAATVLDATWNWRNIRFGSDVWSGEAREAVALRPDIQGNSFLASINMRIKVGEYIDAHCSVFTETSFIKIFRELEEMALCPMSLRATSPVRRPFNEFYALFGRG